MQQELTHLVYPLTQIVIGVIRWNYISFPYYIRLIPTSKYLGVRLQCISMLNQLAKSTDRFIAAGPYILEMLQLPELRKHTKASTEKLNFDIELRVSKGVLQSKVFQVEIHE